MTLQLKSIDQVKQVALFENSEELFSVYYVVSIDGCVIGIDQECGKDHDRMIKIIQDHIDASPKAEQLEQAVREAVGDTVKQERYTDDEGKDLIDEWAETYPIETFRVLMWEQMRKYHRRLGKKDDIAQEVGKIADYARRWHEVEKSR